MPIARYAILLTKINDKTAKRGQSESVLTCNECDKSGYANKEKRWMEFRFFGIPLLTWKRRYSFVCSHCSKIIKEKKASIIQSVLWHFN